MQRAAAGRGEEGSAVSFSLRRLPPKLLGDRWRRRITSTSSRIQPRITRWCVHGLTAARTDHDCCRRDHHYVVQPVLGPARSDYRETVDRECALPREMHQHTGHRAPRVDIRVDRGHRDRTTHLQAATVSDQRKHHDCSDWLHHTTGLPEGAAQTTTCVRRRAVWGRAQ